MWKPFQIILRNALIDILIFCLLNRKSFICIGENIGAFGPELESSLAQGFLLILFNESVFNLTASCSSTEVYLSADATQVKEVKAQTA